MITSVTTTTVSAIAALGASAALGAMAVVAVILLLVNHELLSGTSASGQAIAATTRVAIVPLLAVFALVVALRLAASL